VWVVDSKGHARHRAVRIGAAGSDGMFEVVEGLNATDKLIADGRQSLRDGDRVTITGENEAIGTPDGQ
jgi:hypothetical protein